MAKSAGHFVFKWRGKKATTAIRRQVSDGVREITVAVRNQAREIISTPYPPASAPFDPPHRRTGDLLRSIKASFPDDLTGIVSAGGGGVDYAATLEFGGHIIERPFMRPAFDEVTSRAKEFFK